MKFLFSLVADCKSPAQRAFYFILIAAGCLRRVNMIVAVEIGYGITALTGFFGRISANCRLAVATGYVENIGRLAETGEIPPQGGNDSLAFFDR